MRRESTAPDHVERTGGPDSARLPSGLSLRCESHSGCDARDISHALCRTSCAIACRYEQVKIVLSYVESGGLVSVSEAHTASDGIMDPKPVLVTWNQADTTRRQITKLSHFVEAGRSNSSIGHETLEQPTRHGIRLRTHNAYPQRRNHGSQAGTRLLEPSRQTATTSNQTP
jgi:hypothetical protein